MDTLIITVELRLRPCLGLSGDASSMKSKPFPLTEFRPLCMMTCGGSGWTGLKGSSRVRRMTLEVQRGRVCGLGRGDLVEFGNDRSDSQQGGAL